MDFIEGLNQVLDYVENHLEVTDNDETSLEKLAKIAGTSVYHFQRMFAYFADMPLSEYVRRRRLSRAAVDLQNGESVLQVSLKYGYNSPTAFNRAFKNIHGIAPSKVQGKNQVVKSYPPLRFVLSVVGKEPLEFRLEKKPSFRIVGISQKLGTTLEENFSKVPKMWMKASLFGTVKKIADLQDNPEVPGVLGVSIPEEDNSWIYYIASASSKNDEKLQSTEIPSFTWAIFSGKGTNRDIQILEKRIVTEWLPTSGYEYDNGPDVEVYLSPDPKNAVFEVWIPVVKK